MTSWTDLLGWTLVHFVWQATVLALAAAAALRLLVRATAQARYAIACAALAFTLVVPLITLVSLGAVTGIDAATPTAAMTIAHSSSAITAGATRHDPDRQRAVPGQSASVPLDRVLPSTSSLDRALPLVVGLWIAGVIAFTARLAVGWWRVRALRLEALAQPPSHWAAAANRLAHRLAIARCVHFVDTDRVDTPTLIGWVRPVIMLPIAALANLSPDQVEAILAHELAHVRRHDFLVNLLQTIGETLLFYHPAVWWLSGRIRVERELCCDDIAVEACGDPLAYAEALTELASWSAAPASMAVAATGGSLLHRVRRLLHLADEHERHSSKAPVVIACTLIIVVAIGVRLLVAAQTTERKMAADDRGLVSPPKALNEIVGFNLVPPMPHYVTDDPRGARAWDVKVTFPGGELPFIGFTARGVIRYAFGVESLPLLDGPSWLDTESMVLRASTPSTNPDESDVRLALRLALEQQFGIAVARTVRDIPVYGLVAAGSNGQLGPNIHASTADCLEGGRVHPPAVGRDLPTIGPHLVARGQNTLQCGMDNGFFGPTGYRVTLSEFARSLRGFPMDPSSDREVVDQTGLTGTFDLVLRPGPLPLAAIASAHPDLLPSVRRLGVLTLPEAIEQQLGLRLVPMDVPREVATIALARRPAL